VSEEPKGTSASSHELLNGNEESNDPEESEEEDPEHPVGILASFKNCEHIFLFKLWGTS
jgi:hypothetical protein